MTAPKVRTYALVDPSVLSQIKGEQKYWGNLDKAAVLSADRNIQMLIDQPGLSATQRRELIGQETIELEKHRRNITREERAQPVGVQQLQKAAKQTDVRPPAQNVRQPQNVPQIVTTHPSPTGSQASYKTADDDGEHEEFQDADDDEEIVAAAPAPVLPADVRIVPQTTPITKDLLENWTRTLPPKTAENVGVDLALLNRMAPNIFKVNSDFSVSINRQPVDGSDIRTVLQWIHNPSMLSAARGPPVGLYRVSTILSRLKQVNAREFENVPRLS